MLINDIIRQINKLLSNSSSFQLDYNRLEPYINVAVDHINFTLKTNMQTPKEEWEQKEWVYTLNNSTAFLGSYYKAPNNTTQNKIYYDISYRIYYVYNGVRWCAIDIIRGTFISEDIPYSDSYLGSYSSAPTVNSELSYPQYYYNTKEYCYYIMRTSSSEWEVLHHICEKELPLDIEQTNIEAANMEYTSMPNDVIRSVLIYHTAASYLEEEDEFEHQYSQYMQRANNNLEHIKQTHYSVYTCNW